MTFDDEISLGFSELADETGKDLTFRGVAIRGVLDGGRLERFKVDLKLGKIETLVLEIARSEIAKLPVAPKVGEAFIFGAKWLRIEDVDGEDVSDPAIRYTVKASIKQP